MFEPGKGILVGALEVPLKLYRQAYSLSVAFYYVES
jgi:hypothetical protein